MAPPQDLPTSITLRVKVAPGHITSGADEFTLGNDIPVSSSVGQIRERIQQTLPTNPTPERQRILYAGRALVDNDVTIAEALNIRRDPSQNEYVVHLLVKGDGTNTATAPPRRPLSAGAAPTMAIPIASGYQQVPQAPQAPQGPSGQTNHAMPHQTATHYQNPHQLALAQAQQMQARMMAGNPLTQRMMPQGGGLSMPQGSFGGSPLPAHGWPGANIAAGGALRLGQQEQGREGAETAGQSPQTGETNLGQQTDGPQAQAQPNMQHRQAAGAQHAHIRGVLPTGERITIHQQTMTFPHGGLPPPHLHHGLRPMQPTVPLTASMQGPAPFAGPSALDRARENITSMRQLLEELREHNGPASEEQQARIARLEERTQDLNNYIDPLRLGAVNNAPIRRSNTPTIPQLVHGSQVPLAQAPSWQQRAQQMRQAQQPASTPTRSTADVTCYLLSSPTGPRAILYSSEHGAYTGSLQSQAHAHGTTLRSPATSTTPNASSNASAAEQGPPAANAVQAPAPPAGQAAVAEQADPMGAMGPFLGHFWLTLRILIFSYFLLGSNMGWRRPIALAAIGLGFWLIRIGVQGDGPIRRWWEGVMDHGQPPRPAQAEQNGQQPLDAQGRAGQMPTPEQLAQRLIEEAERARDQARDGRVQWVRERVRPIERAVALMVASLWPGVGEAYVRAREAEDRRRAEEEVAARRAEEEAKKKQEDDERQKLEEGQQSKQDAAAAASASNAEAAPVNGSEQSPPAHQAFSA